MIETLAGRRLVVCCGAGGVGKTTLSAALALALARDGARAAVVTIDPARRLATTLGLGGLSDEPHLVEGAPTGPGQLWALQLDAKATFDRLVARHAPDAAARERILGNRIYRHLSGAVAGAQEYMAVERLHELVEDGRFERIVLDTPPARNALDFLDAPQRITRFIEGRSLRLLLRPSMEAGRFGWRLLHAGGGSVLSLLERLTGGQLLHDVADFLAAFDGMYQGFSDRAQEVRRLLHSPEAGFVVVAAPEADSLRQREDRFPLAGLVLNRVHPLPASGPAAPGALAAALADAEDPVGLAARAAAALEEERILALRDLDAREALAGAVGGARLSEVPAMPREPVDPAGLAAVADAVAGRAGVPLEGQPVGASER